jgi:tetraacyldisaccharide 4'-kinase
MKAPSFWQSRNLLSTLLTPLGRCYRAVGIARRHIIEPYHAGTPVYCVGNITMGGSGKTPTAIALANELIAAGKKPFFLSKGYGGKEEGPLRVDPLLHRAAEIGDEPLLLARHAPVIIARNRMAGAKRAVAEGAEVIIMDDGFQNPSIYKDYSLLVIDGSIQLGNGLCFPAGSLRETLQDALKRANSVLWIGAGKESALYAELVAWNGTLLHADIEVTTPISPCPVIAFAGIAYPQKFFSTLTISGYDIAEQHSFPDHHCYTERELTHLLTRSRIEKLPLITTEKDWVRLPEALQKEVQVLGIGVRVRGKLAPR